MNLILFIRTGAGRPDAKQNARPCYGLQGRPPYRYWSGLWPGGHSATVYRHDRHYLGFFKPPTSRRRSVGVASTSRTDYNTTLDVSHPGRLRGGKGGASSFGLVANQLVRLHSRIAYASRRQDL